jgi:CheY-like chemotaxis protein
MNTIAEQILVVEDDRFLQRACAVGLRQRGWTELTAGDGEEALNIVQTATIDLILLDMLMPQVPGLQVMRVLKADEKTSAIPVLACRIPHVNRTCKR